MRDTSELEPSYAAAWPPSNWRDSHVALAVSGGADSVAMLRAAVAIKARCGGSGRLFVAHLNHGLRGGEATADAEWLADLCKRFDLPLEVGQCDVTAIAAEVGDGWEAAARSARYDFLRQAAEQFGARFVAVAHTADDQVETVLHRVLRGAGITGLCGMPMTRPLSPSVSLVRPLLALRRKSVVEYLAEIGQTYRTDSTNADVRWTRNQLRHEMLPKLREYAGGDIDSALVRLAAGAAESQVLISSITEELVEKCTRLEYESMAASGSCACGQRASARRMLIDGRALADKPRLIVREVCKRAWTEAGWPLQAMGFGEWQQLAAMIAEERCDRTLNLPSNLRARCEGHALILEAVGLP